MAKNDKRKKKFSQATVAAKEFLINKTSLSLLRNMVDCSLSNNLILTKTKLRMMYNFIKNFKPEDFISSEEKATCVYMLHHILNMRLVQKIDNRLVIKQNLKALGGRYDEKILDILAGVRKNISDTDINALLNIIANFSKFANFSSILNNLQDANMKMVTQDFDSIESLFSDNIVPNITEATRIIRANRHQERSARDFDSSKESMLSMFDSLYKFDKSPGSNIRTGLQSLNKMLGGKGFAASTVTLFMGMTGGWKSGLLLNCASWFVRYNNKIKSFDSSKMPCCIYYSLENDMFITARRLYAIRIGNSEDITTNYSNGIEVGEAVYNDLQKESKGKVHIFFRYKPARSLSSEDIASDVEELAEEGYECRMVIVDYLKRMSMNDSNSYNIDERLRLGIIADELQVLSKDYRLAVVSAQQVNREGVKAAEMASDKRKQDIVKFIMASHAGNSWDLMENVDISIIIAKEARLVNNEIREVLSFKKVKDRGNKILGLEFFSHMLVKDRGMLLEEDFGLDQHLSLKVDDDFTSSLNESEDGPDEKYSRKRRKGKIVDPRASDPEHIMNQNIRRQSRDEGTYSGSSDLDDEDSF